MLAVGPATPRRATCSSSPSTSANASSQTRASSSPPSFPGMNPPEVYDIAAGDGELSHTPQSTTSPAHDLRSFRLARALLKVSPERQKAMLRELGVGHLDAWTLDDWDRRWPSAGSDTHGSEEMQRMIASAVRAEVKVELDSVLQRVMNRMTDLTVHVNDEVEKLSDEDHSLQSALASLSLQVEELQSNLDEYRCDTGKRLEFIENFGKVAFERAAIKPFLKKQCGTDPIYAPATSQPSTSKWCARLDAVEMCLRKSLDRIEVMTEQNGKFGRAISKEIEKIVQKSSLHESSLKILSYRASENEKALKRASDALNCLQVSVRDSEWNTRQFRTISELQLQSRKLAPAPPPTEAGFEPSLCFGEEHCAQPEYTLRASASAESLDGKCRPGVEVVV